MRKLVVLKLDGDLELGVRMTLEIGEEGKRPSTEITGNLPPNLDMLTAIEQWRAPIGGNKPTQNTEILRFRHLNTEAISLLNELCFHFKNIFCSKHKGLLSFK